MSSKGYVALFAAPIDRGALRHIVELWLQNHGQVEQLFPGGRAGTAAAPILQSADILWEKHLQFRVLSGADFAWIYVSENSRVIETTGLPDESATLPLDVLTGLPGVEEIIDQDNDRRLDQLEAEGLM